MTDPRRRRQIKTPTGPRKKEAPSPSSFKMNKPAMGRTEVPKPKPKPDPTQQKRGDRAQKGGRGRQGGRNDRRGGRPQGRREQTRRPRPEALKGVDWGRVLEHDAKTGVAVAMAEDSLAFCRFKVKGSATLTINQRVYIGTDTTSRDVVGDILGMAHLDKMSNMARQSVPTLVQLYVEEHAQYFVDEFYNKAGPMSLKQHSYELLPDVGPVKARNMVKARDQVGVFASMDELNALAKVKGAELLAQRFVEEIEDKTLVPRLIELLLPVKA